MHTVYILFFSILFLIIQTIRITFQHHFMSVTFTKFSFTLRSLDKRRRRKKQSNYMVGKTIKIKMEKRKQISFLAAIYVLYFLAATDVNRIRLQRI